MCVAVCADIYIDTCICSWMDVSIVMPIHMCTGIRMDI